MFSSVRDTADWRIRHGLHPREYYEAGGTSPLRRPVDLTPEEAEQAFASARAGASVRQLTKTFRLTRSSAHGLAQWARVLPLEADLPPHPECVSDDAATDAGHVERTDEHEPSPASVAAWVSDAVEPVRVPAPADDASAPEQSPQAPEPSLRDALRARFGGTP